MEGKVNIHGKEYLTVAYRIKLFREKYTLEKGWAIITALVKEDDQKVIIKATIQNEQQNIIATGHAEENRTGSRINKTSALENCETSAIGRALASAGFAGTEFASANEVVGAMQQQNEPVETITKVDIENLEMAAKGINKTNDDIEKACQYYYKKSLKNLSHLEATRLLKKLIGA